MDTLNNTNNNILANFTAQVNETIDEDSKKLENETKKLHNREIEQSIELREKYSSKIFWFIIWWSIGLFLILILQGSSYAYEKINWNDNIIITLIGTTFIQVLGLMIIVLHYIFPVIKK